MISPNIKKSGKVEVSISKNELKQLVHWAVFGVGKAISGSYQDCIIETIQKYGRFLGMASYKNLYFGELRKSKKFTCPPRSIKFPQRS